MDWLPLIVGSLLTVHGVWFLLQRRDLAEWLYEYYKGRPDPSWRPKWLLWNLRPTHRQTTVMIVVFSLIVLVLGVNGIPLGLGVGPAVDI